MSADSTEDHLDKKEQATVLLELIRGQLDHFNQTRDIEFKVNLALWTAIVVTGGLLHQSGLRLESVSEISIYFLVAFCVSIIHAVFWIMPIQYSQDLDNFILEYRNRVESLCNFSPKTPKPKPRLLEKYEKWRKSGWTWILAESFLTLMLLVGVGIVLMTGTKQPAGKRINHADPASISVLTKVSSRRPPRAAGAASMIAFDATSNDSPKS